MIREFESHIFKRFLDEQLLVVYPCPSYVVIINWLVFVVFLRIGLTMTKTNSLVCDVLCLA